MAELTFDRIQANVERLKWENYQRDFESDQSEVLDIYWHCVTVDLLTENILDDNEALERFSDRFFNSYANCFYHSNKLLHKIYELFDGYSSYYMYEKEKLLWDEWKDVTVRKMGTRLKTLANLVRSSYRLDERIYKHGKRVVDDLGAYDHWHKNLGLPVSDFVIHHLDNPTQDSKYRKPINESAGYIFQFRVDISLSETLHDIGQQFLEKSFPYYCMRMVEKQLGENGKRFSAYPRMSTNEAINHFHKHYPYLESYSIPKKAQLIRAKYRKPNGDRLVLDSIKKNLRRKSN